MSYTKIDEGQVTVFTTQPEAVPVPWGLLVVPAVPIVGFLFVNATVSLVFATLIGALVWARMKVFPAATKHRQPSTFKVSADGVSVDGKDIKRRDIHRAIIRNHVLDGDNPSNFVTLHQGVGAMVGGVGAAANAKAKGQLADISYRVDVEAGGVAHTLAGGLNESTAFAVLSDVSGVLGLS